MFFFLSGIEKYALGIMQNWQKNALGLICNLKKYLNSKIELKKCFGSKVQLKKYALSLKLNGKYCLSLTRI